MYITSGSGHMALVPGQQGTAGQELLGDVEDAEARLAAQAADVSGRLSSLGVGGIQQPKDAMAFVNQIQYKQVGGQQLVCSCMFCNKSITRQDHPSCLLLRNDFLAQT